MFVIVIVAPVLMVAIPLGATQPASEDNAPQEQGIARVGSTEITETEFRTALRQARATELASYSSEEALKKLAIRLVSARVLAGRARVMGLDEEPRIRLRFDAMLRDELVRREVDGHIKLADITEDEIEAYYQEHRQEFLLPGMLSLHHVFLARDDLSNRSEEQTRELAERVLQEARKSAPSLATFQTLVREYSEDSQTRTTHGLVGPFVGEELSAAKAGPVGSMIEGALSLERVGDVCGPIDTPEGLHIVRLSGRRAARQRSLTEVRESTRRTLFDARRQQLLNGLLKESGLDIAPEIDLDCLRKFLPQPRRPRGDQLPPPLPPLPDLSTTGRGNRGAAIDEKTDQNR